MPERLLIVGASARAAAMSAVRSGFAPWAADRFGDLDLRACAEAVRIDDYPGGLEHALAGAPPGPWIYTGALENRLELIDRLSASRKLLGIGGESLRAVRDPFRLAAVLAAAGLTAPANSRSADGLPRDGSWLRKPFASAGGSGVQALSITEASSLKPQAYFQQRIDGVPVGAVYVAAERRATLLGVTRQLIGLDWCGLAPVEANRFRYCGSIGPLDLNEATENRFSRIGNLLAEAFDLRGLFGIDAIVVDGDIWPVEVNPRYTASVEVLERAVGIRSIALHVAAFDSPPGVGSPSVQAARTERHCCGKAILFATVDTIVSRDFAEWCRQQDEHGEWPTVADIPAAGTPVALGQPIATVLAAGQDEPAVLARLKSLAASAYGVFSSPADWQTSWSSAFRRPTAR